MQQMQSLYAGYAEYSGIFKGRPNIPAGEVWVFCQWDGRNIPVSREDEDFRPPPAPLLKHRATKIYKLRRSATYSMTKRYHEVSAFPVTITWSVTVEVHDPVAYIESGQYAHDNLAQIEAALINALQNPVEEMLGERLDPQVISNPHSLAPPPLRQLLPMRDFNNLVRGLPEFRRIGLDVRVAAASVECPAYQQLLSRVTREPQEALLQSQIGMIDTVGAIETGELLFNFEQRKKMIEAANNLQIAMQQLTFDEQYLQSVVGQVREMNPQVLPLLQSVIEQMGNVAANGVDPRVARNMFNPILERIVLFPQQTTSLEQNADSKHIHTTEPPTSGKSQLSLFAIARAEFEGDDRVFIGKIYSAQAGVSQRKPANFEGEAFDMSLRNTPEPIMFDVVFHAGENVELTTDWHKSLIYDPNNPEPQLVQVTFRAKTPGYTSLAINFYHDRRWLKTIRLEFEAIKQSKSTHILIKE